MNIEVNIPDGESGKHKIETFTVSQKEAARYNLRMMTSSCAGDRGVHPGTYKRLLRKGGCMGPVVVMSNTPAEISDHEEFILEAQKATKVLINGLGLGVALSEILKSETVKKVTVIEKSKEVMDLVAPHIMDPRVEIIHADALEYRPEKGVRYGAVWHDIWDDITGDNLKDMAKLHRRYGRRCDWQGSWCRAECERQRRLDKNNAHGYW